LDFALIWLINLKRKLNAENQNISLPSGAVATPLHAPAEISEQTQEKSSRTWLSGT